MSFLVLHGEDAQVREHISLNLEAATTIRIPAMCMGVIPHDLRLVDSTEHSEPWVIRRPYSWADLNLLVDQGPIEPSDPICTRVLNLSQKQVKIPKGAIISRLISVRVE